MSRELWKDIREYEGLYQVSNRGNVKSISYNGRYGEVFRNRIVKGQTTTDGYVKLALNKRREQKWFRVHRLVAQAFISNLNNLPHVNHRNGVKDDNYVTNLRWCTPSQNELHSYRTLGKKSYQLKLDKVDRETIRHLSCCCSYSELAKEYGVCKSTIANIVTKKYRIDSKD